MIYTITLNTAIDRLITVQGALTRKRSNRVKDIELDLGGKGLHVSHALTKFGVENLALGYIGSENKKLMEEILRSKNINHHLLVEEGVSTREAIVILDETDQGSMMITENGFPVSEENHQKLLQFIHQNVTPQDIVIVAGSLPPNYTIKRFMEIIDACKESGCFLACDVSGKALSAVVKTGVHFIKPNQHEVEVLLKSDEDLLSKIHELARNIEYMVVSLGKDGSYVAHDGRIYHVTPPAVIENNDTGAGDVFVGAFIAQLAKGADLETVVKYATGCSASKVTKQNSSDFDIGEAEEYFSEIQIIEVGEAV